MNLQYGVQGFIGGGGVVSLMGIMVQNGSKIDGFRRGTTCCNADHNITLCLGQNIQNAVNDSVGLWHSYALGKQRAVRRRKSMLAP